jgi:hypothetical protein
LPIDPEYVYLDGVGGDEDSATVFAATTHADKPNCNKVQLGNPVTLTDGSPVLPNRAYSKAKNDQKTTIEQRTLVQRTVAGSDANATVTGDTAPPKAE